MLKFILYAFLFGVFLVIVQVVGVFAALGVPDVAWTIVGVIVLVVAVFWLFRQFRNIKW